MRARPQPARPLRRADEVAAVRRADPVPALPPEFRAWFDRRGWQPRAHQLALLDKAAQRRSTLLIAPTGAGKTLAGFLPSLVSLSGLVPAKGQRGIHTLYISPLKALAADVHRNLLAPVEEMGLAIRVETRTGDTSTSRKARQRVRPPDMLLTTPEQVALLLVPRRRAAAVCRADHRRPRRAACARPHQARRPAGARPCQARCHRPRPCAASACRRRSHGRASCAPTSSRSPATAPSASPTSSSPKAARGPTCASSTPSCRCPGPATPPATPSPRSTPPSRRTGSASCSSTPAARPS